MKNPLLEIYSSLVCFVAIVCCSVWLGMGLYGLVGVLEPKITLDKWSYEMYQPDQYPSSLLAEPFILESPEVIEIKNPEPFLPKSDKQIAEERLVNYQLALKSEIRKNKQTLFKSLVAVFICLPLFIFHWRFVRPK
ncbi:MAG: hypothetical protein P8J25_04095 [Porticoccaceae bacterium]|nr:hypothetical protein [Porticoccaceae bacterium]